MTAELDRCHALEMLGYTARQAQFLVRVALHGGYFLRRQYVAFTGTRHGQATVRFLARCVAREHVRVLPYGRDGHVFHLSARPLYAAIGEEDNRNRRPAEWDAVLRKLMTLDFVLAHPTGTVPGDRSGEGGAASRTTDSIRRLAPPELPAEAHRWTGDDTLLCRQDAVVPAWRRCTRVDRVRGY